MRSRYVQIVEAFGERLAFLQGQELHACGLDGWRLTGNAAVPDITLGNREEHRHTNSSPPRIVCVAQGGDFAPVDQPGGGRSVDGSYRANNRLTRQFKIKVYVWGADDTQSESLLHNSLLAFTHITGAPEPGKRVVFSEELWEDQQPGEGGQETFGALISFLVMFEINVTDAPDTLTIVQTIDNRLSYERAPGDTRPLEVTNVTITS